MIPPVFDRRSPDDEKLATQRFVTYVLLIIFTAVAGIVFAGQDHAERSTIMQTVINFTMIAVGFWLGSSKTSADKDASLSRIAEQSAPVAAAAVAAAVGTQAAAPIKTDTMNVEATTANVTEAQPPKGTTP